MARRVEVVLIDDLDGAPADQTVSFALDGTNYEIDLSESNAGSLRDLLSTYVAASRKTTSVRAKARRKSKRPR